MKDVYKETLTTGLTFNQCTFSESVKLFFGIKHCMKIMLCCTQLNESPSSRTEPQPFDMFTFTLLEGTWDASDQAHPWSGWWIITVFQLSFSPPPSVSPPTFLMKSDFTKWETFKFLCFENNFCSGSGLEWETCLTPASSNAVLSQVPIRMLVACIVAVGIFSVTTGAGQDTCSGPDLLAFQPYPEHITEEVIYFPVNHLELSGLLMMCGWYWELFGCLLAMSSQWHGVVYLKSLHTWTGSWCRSLKNVKV